MDKKRQGRISPGRRDRRTSHGERMEKLNDSFSFLDCKNDLRKLFLLSDLICNEGDFWKFVSKFEVVEKRKHKKVKGDEGEFNGLCVINLHFGVKDEELYSRIPYHEGAMLSDVNVKEFSRILLSYLDFEQKQLFAKLKKLREAQAQLPVAQFRAEIIETIAHERVVIIAGDTGCGKSTQIPRYLLKAGFNKIACTQPRRIACIALSKRVAFETLNKFGQEIGFQIRFDKNVKQETKIIFVTEGLLLRQIAGDSTLSNYDVVVLDEVHERHLHGDFLLGILKCLLIQRKDFKLILMSATINLNLFADYFGGNAKVIQVPGRLHPIQVHYRPITEEDRNSKREKLNPSPYVRVMQLIDNKYSRDERGDLLIFLSGMSEITTLVEAANTYNEKAKSWIVLPLHSTLSIDEQDKVFDYAPEGMRKCVISTNIAETSITIDGIRFVVDSGMVKEMSYDPVCKMQLLKEFWISKASAEQRKGRAGRTGPGVCFRLFSEEDYEALTEFATPEIQRVPLDSVLLQMMAMGLPDVRKFPFLEIPPSANIENAVTSLKQHCALTLNEKLTPIGEMLAQLPVDIPLGKMLLMGTMFHQIQPILSLVAALSVQSPFTNRAYRDPECEMARKALESDHGDPLTLLNVLREWLKVKSGSGNGTSGREKLLSRRWCKKRGLEEQRFYEMVKLRHQFKDLLQECKLLKDDVGNCESMSSAERALRHGELKLLKSLKRSHAQLEETEPKKRNILRPDTWTIEDDTAVDIRDIDFRLANNHSKLKNLLSGTTACSYKDLTIIKVILCSGLYPQFAISDEFNNSKGVGDQLFHTQMKPFVFLHPLSLFGNNSQILQLAESDIVQIPGFNSRNPVSTKHQILCYMSLLETSKPYLVNTMRMPAAQTLLLFSNKIQSNNNFTCMICDSWIQLRFPAPPTVEKLVQKVFKIRSKWDLLLKNRLEEKESEFLEHELTNSLIDLMASEISYSIKRLLPADLKGSYKGVKESYNLKGFNPLSPDYEMHVNDETGGVQIAPYFTYNCLLGDDAMLEIWECPICGLSAPLESLEKLQHIQSCQSPEDKPEVPDKRKSTGSEIKPNSLTYFCQVCQDNFWLTPVQILKHKRLHLNNTLTTQE